MSRPRRWSVELVALVFAAFVYVCAVSPVMQSHQSDTTAALLMLWYIALVCWGFSYVWRRGEDRRVKKRWSYCR